MFWIPAFAGMTYETDELDESNPYISGMTGEMPVLPIG